MLENELKDAHEAYNTRYTAGKAPSKRYSATIVPPSMPAEAVSEVPVANAPAVAPRISIVPIPEETALEVEVESEAEEIVEVVEAPVVRVPSIIPGVPVEGGASGISSRKSSALLPVKDSETAVVEVPAPRASLLASGDAPGPSRRPTALTPDVSLATAAEAPSRASLLGQRAPSMVSQGIFEAPAQRASLLAQKTGEPSVQRASLLAQANAVSRRVSAIVSEVIPDVPAQRSASIRRPSSFASVQAPGTEAAAGASRRSSSVLSSRRPTIAGIPEVVQEAEVPIKRSSSARPSTAMAPAIIPAGASRRSSAISGSKRGTAVIPDQLQEKLEDLENEIREANAKRNTLLAGNTGSDRNFDDIELEDPLEFELLGDDVYPIRRSLIPVIPGPSRRASSAMPGSSKRYSTMIPGIAAEAGGGSRSSTRSRSSQGSRSGVVAFLY